MSEICNEDCLHCPYEDCVLDKITLKGLRQVKEIEKTQKRREPHKKKNDRGASQAHRNEIRANRKKIYMAAYTAERREEINDQRALYREQHRDEINMHSREWRADHKEEVNARRREKYSAKKEEINARRREEYAAHREARNAQNAAYVEQHRDEINARRRQRTPARKAAINARQREWYAAHKEEMNARRREQRCRQKEQAAGAQGKSNSSGQQPVPAEPVAPLGKAFEELQKSGHCDTVASNSNQMLGG